jgi:hypothetical protein
MHIVKEWLNVLTQMLLRCTDTMKNLNTGTDKNRGNPGYGDTGGVQGDAERSAGGSAEEEVREEEAE